MTKMKYLPKLHGVTFEVNRRFGRKEKPSLKKRGKVKEMEVCGLTVTGEHTYRLAREPQDYSRPPLFDPSNRWHAPAIRPNHWYQS